MHARKLHKIEEFRNVYVNPDLTQKERIAQKELRQELAQQKAAGEKDIYIRKGPIVHKSSKETNLPSVVPQNA